MKKGVSLITVLLFMLVATIAATATFKLVTSQSKSSASRLMEMEARQASLAGIESARAWMSHNGNATGAIVKQFLRNHNKPIRLNSLIGDFSDNKQNYNVWLAGVSITSDGYMLKIISNGTTPNGSSYSEIAILKVSGLYQVKIPVEKVNKKINLHDTYFGGSVSETAGGILTHSMTINGNWRGNPSGIDSEFVVTGNVDLTGNNIQLGKNNCIGGFFNPENDGVKATNLYVHGTMKSAGGTLSGNAYFNGDMQAAKTVDLNVGGNMTLNGKFTPHDQKKTSISGNLCLGNNGQLKYSDFKQNDITSNAAFTVDGNVWMPSYENMHGNSTENFFNFLTLGKKQTSEVYIAESDPCDKFYRFSKAGMSLHLDISEKEQYGSEKFNRCDADPKGKAYQSHPTSWSTYTLSSGWNIQGSWKYSDRFHLFNTKGKLYSTIPNEIPFECAESIKNYCDNIWKDTVGCDGTSFRIKDVLKTAIDKFENYENTDCMKKLLKPDNPNFNMDNLTGCWDDAKSSNQLYNDYLVVKSSGQNIASFFQNPIGSFKKKFFFIVEDQLSDVKLPQTDNGSYVMFYLAKGGKRFDQTQCPYCHFNYFIYSTGDIDALLSKGNQAWNGTFYLPSSTGDAATSCKGIKHMHTANIQLDFNNDLIESLTEAELICNIDVVDCGKRLGGGSDEEDLESDEADEEGNDPYHISVAPQLSVTISSQYKNNENIDLEEDEEIKSSIIVLPRVIYLPKDAIGKLSDYFSVVSLNGANVTGKATPTALTPNAPTTSGKLVTNGEELTEGVYTYNYEENGFQSRFYVKIMGKSTSLPYIRFSGSDQELKGGVASSQKIQMVVPKVEGAIKNFSVDIAVTPENLSGWTLIPATGVQKSSSKNGVYTYSGLLSNADQIVDLFTLNIDESAESNRMQFIMQNPVNCIPTNPREKSISITGSFKVDRKNIQEYCNKYDGEVCDKYESYFTDPFFYCDNGTKNSWLKLASPTQGFSCIEIIENNTWQCNLASNVSFEEVGSSNEYCEVVIPTENNSIDITENNKAYNLYASMVRKPHKLTLNLKNVDDGSKVEVYARTFNDIDSTLVETCDDDKCEYIVYSGLQYTLKVIEKGSDKFSNWNCEGNNCLSEDPPGLTYPISFTDNNTITVHFNVKDNHCFYEDFSNLKAFCNGENCIEACEKDAACSVVNENASTKWVSIFQTKNGNKKNEPPTIDNVIYSNNDKTAANQSGKNFVILNKAEGGPNGKLSATFQTMISNKDNDILNSGFILRSTENASEYLIVSFYGNESAGNALTARVCKGKGQSMNNDNSCIAPAKLSPSLAIEANSMIKVRISAEDNNLSIEAEVNETKATAQISLDEKKLKGLYENTSPFIHNYVGFNLSNTSFKIYDISWASESYNENCHDIPKVSCIFKANYLGGRVPLDTDVTPWVGMSSWFDDYDKNCSIEYYYNGCDNASSSTTVSNCLDENSAGVPEEIGGKLTSKYYHFTKQGPHGNKKTKGTSRDAKVKIVCDGDNARESSLNGQVFSCGRFDVGEIESCVENKVFTKAPISGSAGYNTEIEIPEANLRNATLILNVTEAYAPIHVVLSSGKNGNENSEVITFTAGVGQKEAFVDNFANVEPFNLQKVTKITISSESNFTIESISTSCRDAVNVSNCTANWNGSSWNVYADINNADKCEARPNGATDKTVRPSLCEGKTLFKFNEPSEPGEHKFIIEVNKKGVSRFCEATGTISSQDTPQSSSSNSSASSALSCPKEISDQDPTSNISVSASIYNCDNCKWTIKDKDGFTKGSGYVSDGFNFTDASAQGEREYTLNVNGESCKFSVSFSTTVQGACTDPKQEKMRQKYCPEFACDNIETTSNDNNKYGDINKCVYTKTKPKYVNTQRGGAGSSGCAVTVNGKEITNYTDKFDDSPDGYIITINGSSCWYGLDL